MIECCPLVISFPNPFNPITIFQYDFRRWILNITVYDLLGNEVNNLVKSINHLDIKHVNWENRQISAGVYLYSLKQEILDKQKK